MARARAHRRARGAARARLRDARAGARRGRAAARRARARGGGAARCVAAARASCMRTTCSRRSAGARWPRRAQRARGWCCTCTSTAWCAPSACASRAARNARAATGATRCPGVRLNCRGNLGEAAAYAASLALWQRRLVEQADAVIVPSVFARERLRALGAPLPWERVHVLAPRRAALARQAHGTASAGPTRWSSHAWRPRRESTSRSTPAGWRACPWWSPARGPSGRCCD